MAMMTRKLGPTERARGRRLQGIREAMGVTQRVFATHLNVAAERLGLPAVYRHYTVSRIEAGSISFEDAAVVLSLYPGRNASDPLKWNWLAFGLDHLPAPEDPEDNGQLAHRPSCAP